MRKIEIEVTQQDINEGEQNEAEDCPVALALNRATQGWWSVDEDGAKERWETDIVGNGIYGPLVKLPDNAIAFVTAFDSWGDDAVSPFSFELELPDAS